MEKNGNYLQGKKYHFNLYDKKAIMVIHEKFINIPVEYTKMSCAFCGNKLSIYYKQIISKLRKNNLLTENFEALCCNCNLKRGRTHNEN